VTSFIKAITELGDSRILNAVFSTPEKVNLTFTFFVESSNDIYIELSLWLSILCLDKKFPQIVEEYLSEFSERLDNFFTTIDFLRNQVDMEQYLILKSFRDIR
jgi:hypothetical protein